MLYGKMTSNMENGFCNDHGIVNSTLWLSMN